MKKFLAGLALSAALVAGTATVATAPANAAGIYVNVGGGHHYHRHHRHHWRNHHRGYYHHNRYWDNRYRCHRHNWCYR
jgi:opacity protein-like surface antigen